MDKTASDQRSQNNLETRNNNHYLVEIDTQSWIEHLRRSTEVGRTDICDAEWAREQRLHLASLGELMKFLRLAKADNKSIIGWTPNKRFVQVRRRGKAEMPYLDRAELNERDTYIMNLLQGIAASVLYGSDASLADGYGVTSFAFGMLWDSGLLRSDPSEYAPTPLLRRLLVRAVKNHCQPSAD
jgi:hypothetical protein